VAPDAGDALGGLGQTLGDVDHGLSQEGLGFFLDPLGAMDRQKAQRELKDKFEIIDPSKFKGTPRPNQVSERVVRSLRSGPAWLCRGAYRPARRR
jgi:hypothetical protein